MRKRAARQPAHAASGLSTEYLLMLLSVLDRVRRHLAGVPLVHPAAGSSGQDRGREFPFLYKLLYNKYYVDQLYDAMFVNRMKDLALTLGAFDVNFINGLGVDGVRLGDARYLDAFPAFGIPGLWMAW